MTAGKSKSLPAGAASHGTMQWHQITAWTAGCPQGSTRCWTPPRYGKRQGSRGRSASQAAGTTTTPLMKTGGRRPRSGQPAQGGVYCLGCNLVPDDCLGCWPWRSLAWPPSPRPQLPSRRWESTQRNLHNLMSTLGSAGSPSRPRRWASALPKNPV